MDDGYNGVVDAISIIQSGPDFERIKPELIALRDKVVGMAPKEASELIKSEISTLFGDIAGVNAVNHWLARRAVR